MLFGEKLAIAAHLHVLLRRKTGRVTDTEWMAENMEYAAEIVRFARARAQEDGHADLMEWADKLELAMSTGMGRSAREARAKNQDLTAIAPPRGFMTSSVAMPRDAGTLSSDTSRYVRGLR